MPSHTWGQLCMAQICPALRPHMRHSMQREGVEIHAEYLHPAEAPSDKVAFGPRCRYMPMSFSLFQERGSIHTHRSTHRWESRLGNPSIVVQRGGSLHRFLVGERSQVQLSVQRAVQNVMRLTSPHRVLVQLTDIRLRNEPNWVEAKGGAERSWFDLIISTDPSRPVGGLS